MTPQVLCRGRRITILSLALLGGALAVGGAILGEAQAQVELLQIGTSGTVSAAIPGANAKAAEIELHDFIKSETGLENQILRQKNWRELADGLAGGKLHVGAFQGYEFAWAKARQPKLTPIALAVNVHIYPTVHVLGRQDVAAAKFAELRGLSIAVPGGGADVVRFYVDRQALANGKESSAFFSKIANPSNVEDAIDDAVDGLVQAAAVSRVGMEAYMRRKPGRFARLKEIAQSEPFPSTVLAYHVGGLDEKTLRLLNEGLANTSRTERGKELLTPFRLTGFEPAPADFDKVLAEVRRLYPPTEK